MRYRRIDLKNVIIAIITILVVFAAAARPLPVRAAQAEASLCIACMYDWWYPVFQNLHYGDATRFLGTTIKHDEDGSFMLGPTLKVWFGKWRMELTPLFGASKNDFRYSSLNWDVTVWNIISPPPYPNWGYITVGDSTARRYDVDLKFAKSLHRFFNFNIGGRFNYGGGEGKLYRFYMPLDFNYGEDKYHLWQVGPVIGIGFNVEIKNLTIYFDVNGIINLGNNYLERKLVLPGLFPWVVPFKYDTYLLGFGFDTDAGIEYYIEQAHISVGAGFRWVGVVCAAVDDNSSLLDLSYQDKWMNGRWDHFFGITFSVSYTF
jgi:hypothetical protein